MLGTLADGRLALEELHRYPNQPVRLPTGLYWDTLRLFYEICQGLRACGRERKLALDGIGIDTWGVDFALLGADGALVDNPRHYRDERNARAIERAFAAVPREEIFRRTGIQFMQFNSLYQLYAMKLAGAPPLETAAKLLFMPDLFNYFLTGAAKCELTDASTSQFYDPVEHRWAIELFETLGLPARILGDVVPPGTRVGPLLPHVAEESGLAGDTPVFATAGHDTASAVAAVPAAGHDWCYISSGTWSLLGAEVDAPIINDRALEYNFTNELGAAGRVRLLKNIAGLWLLQECRRAWALAGHDYSYAELTAMAAAAPSPGVLIDVNAFLSPGRMPEQIAAHCRATGQRPLSTPADFTRAILESLAACYARTLAQLEALLGRRIETIHIVGGGSRNALLNQLTADATGRRVVAGPVEATAAGNVLVQAMGAGHVHDLADAREIVRRSFDLAVYQPRGAAKHAPSLQ